MGTPVFDGAHEEELRGLLDSTHPNRDGDRLIFSAAFRRMKDKTQVFPLEKNDYVRTRLTHSLEVSCVGRSLGSSVGTCHRMRNRGRRRLVKAWAAVSRSASFATPETRSTNARRTAGTIRGASYTRQ